MPIILPLCPHFLFFATTILPNGVIYNDITHFGWNIWVGELRKDSLMLSNTPSDLKWCWVLLLFSSLLFINKEANIDEITANCQYQKQLSWRVAPFNNDSADSDLQSLPRRPIITYLQHEQSTVIKPPCEVHSYANYQNIKPAKICLLIFTKDRRIKPGNELSQTDCSV